MLFVPIRKEPCSSPVAAKIRYTVSCLEPETHYLAMEVRVTVTGTGPVRLAMPVWAPGSYSVDDFAGRLHDMRITDESGRPLRAGKPDKCTWEIEPGKSRTVVANYKLFALDVDVHRNYLDDARCTINGTAAYVYVDGRKDEPVEVQFRMPRHWKRIDTGLTRTRDKTVFTAPTYDDLADCPVFMGNHVAESFEVQGVQHTLAIVGPGNYDVTALTADTKRIVEEGIRLFGDIPYDHYTFLMEMSPEGYGGLEHKNSTHCIFPRWGFQPRKDYVVALGLISHEYFHTWNVKRLRPHGLGPFDYSKEVYTDLLWFAEGFTSYYDLLLTVRCGAISPREYLDEIGRELRRLWNHPGRAVMTLAESSHDTWVKLYRPTADSPNTTISYYNKGCLFGLALDLEIRRATKNKQSLDDVMRLLYREHYVKHDRGITCADVEAACAQVAGRSLAKLFDLIVRGTAEVDWNVYLAHAGLEVDNKARPKDPAKLRHGDERARAYLGVRLKAEAGGTFVTQALHDGAIHAAGIAPGDELIAMDGIRCDEGKLEKWMSQSAPGRKVTFTTARSGALRTVECTLKERPLLDFSVQPKKSATALEKEICRDWARGAWHELDRPERGFDYRPREKIL